MTGLDWFELQTLADELFPRQERQSAWLTAEQRQVVQRA